MTNETGEKSETWYTDAQEFRCFRSEERSVTDALDVLHHVLEKECPTNHRVMYGTVSKKKDGHRWRVKVAFKRRERRA